MMPKKILIVDDELSYCEAVRDFMVGKGYHVRIATSGDAALDFFKKDRPDAVLLDVRMPGKNGIETLREMKALDKGARVIIVTAFYEKEIVENALAEGAFDYINKPVNFHSLEHALRMMLDGAGADDGNK